MNNEEKLAKLNKTYKIVQWTTYGLAGLWLALAFIPMDFGQTWGLTPSILLVGVAAGIYSSTLKRQIQNLEYRTLAEAVEKAQIAALEAEVKSSSAKSRAAKAMSGGTPANPVASLQDLPQSADPEIRTYVTAEAVEQQIQLSTLHQKTMNTWANVCLGIGIFSGVCGFVLPLQACSAAASGYNGLSAGITAFFTVLLTCIGVGVAFGVVAATLRSRSRAAGNRLHELKMQGIRVKASRPNKN
ncbi:MAG: hypothetical protein RL719_1165 [Actinomycetota bacterium]